jgi:hypothetical protein
MWCNSICDATQYVTQLNMWRNSICDVTQYVTQQNMWRNSICDITQYVTQLNTWRNSHFEQPQYEPATLWCNHTVTLPHCDATTLWRNSHHDASYTVTQFIMVYTLLKTDNLVWKTILYLFQIKYCPFCYLRSCCFFIWNVLAYLQVFLTDLRFLTRRKKTFGDQEFFSFWHHQGPML